RGFRPESRLLQQSSVLSFHLFQDWNLRGGLLPEREELLIHQVGFGPRGLRNRAFLGLRLRGIHELVPPRPTPPEQASPRPDDARQTSEILRPLALRHPAPGMPRLANRPAALPRKSSWAGQVRSRLSL